MNHQLSLPLSWTSVCLTHVGRVRKVNEDACLDRPELRLWAVADGMGGHDAGDLASRWVIEALRNLAPDAPLETRAEAIRCRLREVNLRLREEAARRQGSVIGSTVAVLLGADDRCAALWAGDSRIYVYRDGALRLVSRDHSRVQELVDLGLLHPEEAETHPHRNIITRAVGAYPQLEVDTEVLEVEEGDRFLLCSDGLTKEVSDAEISGLLREARLEQSAEALLETALARGGSDNISLVLVEAGQANPT
jgi:protein phosphatase